MRISDWSSDVCSSDLLAADLIVPVFFGSAEHGNGVTRLWKALRHETPAPQETAARLGIADGDDLAATVFKSLHQSHTGKLSIARLWHGSVAENAMLGSRRLAGLYRLHGAAVDRCPQAGPGDVVAFGRLDEQIGRAPWREREGQYV